MLSLTYARPVAETFRPMMADSVPMIMLGPISPRSGRSPNVARRSTDLVVRNPRDNGPDTVTQPVAEVDRPDGGRIWLTVDGRVKPDFEIAKLIWAVPGSPRARWNRDRATSS